MEVLTSGLLRTAQSDCKFQMPSAEHEQLQNIENKAFMDIRLHPDIATPLMVVG